MIRSSSMRIQDSAAGRLKECFLFLTYMDFDGGSSGGSRFDRSGRGDLRAISAEERAVAA